jgi:hypothetical protein
MVTKQPIKIRNGTGRWTLEGPVGEIAKTALAGLVRQLGTVPGTKVDAVQPFDALKRWTPWRTRNSWCALMDVPTSALSPHCQPANAPDSPAATRQQPGYKVGITRRSA